MTIRVPTTNALPDTADALVQAVTQAHLLQAVRAVAAAPIMDFVALLGSRQDVEVAIRAFEEKAAALKMTQAYALFVAGEFVRSQAMLLVLIDDRNAQIDTRFAAALTLDQVEHRLGRHRNVTPFLTPTPMEWGETSRHAANDKCGFLSEKQGLDSEASSSVTSDR